MLAALHQSSGAHLAGVVLCERLSQSRIHKAFEHRRIRLAAHELVNHVAPAQPAKRAVKARELKASSLAAIARCSGAPFTTTQQGRLMQLSESFLARLAFIRRAARIILLPLELRPLQPLHRAATWAWHKVTALITALILRLDTAEVLDGRRTGQQDLPPRERRRSFLGQADRIALAVNVQREGVHLIEEDVAARRRSQPRG